MPLSEPADREPLHNRDIALRGYQRRDGLFDIEARLTDTRTYAFANHDRGLVAPGEPLHEMSARLTIDEALLIVEAEASTEFGPFQICGGGAESFSRLAGLTIGPGFLKAATQRMAGTTGCTHLRELLQQMATTAIQTLYPVRRRLEREAAARTGGEADVRPAPRLLNTCYAYASDRDAVRQQWPQLYTGPVPALPEPAAD